MEVFRLYELRKTFFFNYLISYQRIRNIVFRFLEKKFECQGYRIYKWYHLENDVGQDNTFTFRVGNMMDCFTTDNGWSEINGMK
jgi:hypothetical protein